MDETFRFQGKNKGIISFTGLGKGKKPETIL